MSSYRNPALITAVLLICASLALLGVSQPSLAGRPAAAESINPLDHFAHLPGRWRITPYFPSADGLSAGQAGESKIVSVLDGAAYQGSNRIPFPGGELRMHNLLSYDANKAVFRFVAIDQGTAVLDVYEGRYADGALEVDNVASGLYFTNSAGKRLQFRLRWYDMEQDRFRFDVFWTDNGGQSWSIYAGHVYERLEESAAESG